MLLQILWQNIPTFECIYTDINKYAYLYRLHNIQVYFMEVINWLEKLMMDKSKLMFLPLNLRLQTISSFKLSSIHSLLLESQAHSV